MKKIKSERSEKGREEERTESDIEGGSKIGESERENTRRERERKKEIEKRKRRSERKRGKS